MRSWIYLTVVFVFGCNTLVAQTEFPSGKPLFPPVTSWFDASVDQSQVDLMRSLDQPKDQPLQFALPVPVALNPSNAGFTVKKGGETVWVMAVASKGALSLNAILSPFNLPDGAYVYIYDEGHEVVRGAFTSESGKGTLPTLPVPGDRMVIESHFPGGTIPANAIGVSQIAHDFAGFFRLTSSKDIYYGRSGGCEVDLNCSINQKYLLSSRSVCRLLVAGTELCSGTLINNTGKDYKAYVLTANHCIESEGNALNTIFVFNYESPWCDGPDYSRQHSISGSILRASNTEIDFALVELSSFPSLVIRPYFSGWDITATLPASTYTVHHPQGDVKKISVDDNPPLSSSYPVSGYAPLGFWRILRWDLGTTEAGSSGGGLFDQNSRLRGTLTGGAANCANPENDYYAKLSRMFSISTVPASNLKPWLDPLSTGSTLVSGRDPYAWNISRSDTLRNISAGDPVQTELYPLPGYGYSTGTNSDNLIRYAEYFSFAGTGEIAWIRLNITKTVWINTADSIRVTVWGGGAVPGPAIVSKLINLQEVRDNLSLEVDFGRTVAVTGSFYAGYTVYYKTPPGTAQPQFAVSHSQPYTQPALNTAWFYTGTAWQPFTQHPSFPMAVSLDIIVIMVENSILNDISDPIVPNAQSMVFPNPFSRSVSFSMSDSARITSLTVYDNKGSVVSSTQYSNIFPGIITLDLPALASGVYHYILKNDSEILSGTIIKIDAD